MMENMGKIISNDNYYDQIKKLNVLHYAGEVSYYIQAPLRWAEKKLIASIHKGSKILDVGCGSGRFSIGIAQMGYNVTGLDITPEAIIAAEKKAKNLELKNAHFFVGDMTDMPFNDNDYDFVFCPRFSINAVATFQRRQKAIQEMMRVVKPGGFVYIESFNRFYLGKGPVLLLRKIFSDAARILGIMFCFILRKRYKGLLPGDIVYEANKVASASKGYAHLPTIFELKKMVPARSSPKFFSIPEILNKDKTDLFKYFRYSIWILIAKSNVKN